MIFRFGEDMNNLQIKKIIELLLKKEWSF